VHPQFDNADDAGYDSDADLEPPLRPGDPDYMDLDNHEHVRKNEAGDHVFDWEAMDQADIQKYKNAGCEVDADGPTRFNRVQEDVDPVTQTFEWQYYFRDICDIDNPMLLTPSEPLSNAVLPLKKTGPGVDDFLFANYNHPSKYAVIEDNVTSTDSKREPRPTFLKGRRLPDAEFVKKYKGYSTRGICSGLVWLFDEG
jgi:hypothetical protein